MKRLLRTLFWIVLVAAVAGGGFWLYRTRFAKTTNAKATSFTQIVQVTRGNLSSAISVVGQLESLQSAGLTFERMSGSAKLETLNVTSGAAVKAGQVLATIDPAPYKQALDEARSNLAAAEEKLAGLTTPPTELEILQADQAIARANQSLEQAKADLADVQAPDLAALQLAVQNARDSLVLAQLAQTQAEHDATAKSERDLQYAVSWHERRIPELQALVAKGQANAEQVKALAEEPETLAKAQADLATAQAKRQLAILAAATRVTSAQLALAESEEALATAQAGGAKLTLAKAKVAVQEAEVSLASAKDAKAKLTAGADAVALASAQADLDRKRLAASDAELALAGCNLVAPFNGTVLRVNTRAGNTIGPTTAILTLADMKALQVNASVDETSIRRVSAGQNATMTFDALPGQTLRGQIQSVPLQGTLQGGVTVYQVPISVTVPSGTSLLVGMTANVKIQAGSKTNALLVPATAVQRSGGAYQVLVPSADPNGAPQAVPVEIGLSDGVNTEIVKGLNLGDKVVVQMQSTTTNQQNQQRGPGGEMIFFEAGGGMMPGGGIPAGGAPPGR